MLKIAELHGCVCEQGIGFLPFIKVQLFAPLPIIDSEFEITYQKKLFLYTDKLYSTKTALLDIGVTISFKVELHNIEDNSFYGNMISFTIM